MRIRDATAADMAACLELYNALIDTTTVAWTDERQTLDERQAWFEAQQRDGFPVLVAVDTSNGTHATDPSDATVIGYASYGSFRGSGKWPGYRYTVEHSIHVAEPWWGRGIGRALIEDLIATAEQSDVHVMVGAVDADNVESIRFHERLGFVEVARMPEVGRKFDRWLDLVLMQRIVGSEPSEATGELAEDA